MNFTLELDPQSPFASTLTWQEPEPGLRLGCLTLEAPEPAVAPQVKLVFSQPAGDVCSLWTPTGGMDKGLRWDWGAPIQSGPTSGTPVAWFTSPFRSPAWRGWSGKASVCHQNRL